MKRKIPIALLLLTCSIAHAEICLEDMMTKRQMRRTGIDRLSYSQKLALERWIDDNFEEREDRGQDRKPIYLSLNVENGAQLEFSDGSSYEIDPEDQIYTAYWIAPFPVRFGRSYNRKYPVKITNMNTGTSVNAKRISPDQILKEHRERAENLMQQKMRKESPPETTTPQKEHTQE